jgi:lipopolysaccharide biosynthesis protein
MHLFYQDLWEELAGYVANLRLPYDLYVNLAEGNPRNPLLTRTIHRRFPTAHVQATENRGRDIGGFFRLIAAVLHSGMTYDSVILMHSKKTIHQRPHHGLYWRTSLLRSILGWPDRAIDVALSFVTDPDLGMVGSQDWLFNDDNRPDLSSQQNRRFIDDYCRRFDLHTNRSDFIAGTMFWARAQPFLGIFADHDPLALAAELEPGDHHDDGRPTRTHALERIFGYIVTAQGFTIRGLSPRRTSRSRAA